MTDNRKLYYAIDSIDEDIVREAAAYRFKKERFLPRVLAAAAAVLILGGAVFAATKLVNKPAPEQSAALPTEAAETPVPTPDISAMRIVEGSGNGIMIGENTFESNSIHLFGTLRRELEKETEPCLYAVDIRFLHSPADSADSGARDELYKKWEEAYHNPLSYGIVHLMMAWSNDAYYEVFTQQEKDMWNAEERDQDYFIDKYLDVLSQTEPEDIVEAYRKAYYDRVKAGKDYDNYFANRLSNKAVINSLYELAQELTDHGIIVYPETFVSDGWGFYCEALLTKEQIEDLPKIGDTAYLVYFSNERDELASPEDDLLVGVD